MQNKGNNFMSYFLPSEFIDTFLAIAFVNFVDKIPITDMILSHVITEVSATLFKYLLFSQIHVNFFLHVL